MVGRVDHPERQPAVAAADAEDRRTRGQAVLDEDALQLVADPDEPLVVLVHEPELGRRQRERSTGASEGHRCR